MVVQDIYLGDDPSKIYLERDGKLFTVHASPFRALTETDLTEIGTSIPLGAYKQAQHLCRPTESFFACDAKTYGLDRRNCRC